jgi:hypothetical protein
MSRTKVSVTDITQEQYDNAKKIIEEGGTKKAACIALDIKYNTKKMESLLEEYAERFERQKRLRAERRRKAVTKADAVDMITDYLKGNAISTIADYNYISTARVKATLERYGANFRKVSSNYYKPDLLPDRSIADTHEIGDWVWSSRYNCLCQVKGMYKGAYRIIMANGDRKQAYQPAEELGSTKHLVELGVNFESITNSLFLSTEDQLILINQGIANARKKSK